MPLDLSDLWLWADGLDARLQESGLEITVAGPDPLAPVFDVSTGLTLWRRFLFVTTFLLRRLFLYFLRRRIVDLYAAPRPQAAQYLVASRNHLVAFLQSVEHFDVRSPGN